MGLDQKQFRELIVTPALDAIDLGGEAAINLIVGTALIESKLQHVKQLGAGPALSVMQIEPATYDDTRVRMCGKHPETVKRGVDYLHMNMLPFKADYLMGNLSAAVIMARFKYYLDPSPLPGSLDWKKLAAYYKRIYNTADGATSIEDAEKIFRSVVLGYHYHG